MMKYKIYLTNKPIEEATLEEKRALYVKIALSFYRLAGRDTEEIFKVFGEQYRKLDNVPRNDLIQNENKSLEKIEAEKELSHMYELNRIERKEYYTKTDIKNLLSIQQSQVNEIFERDDFPCFLVADRYWRITKKDFNEWLDKQKDNSR